MIRVAVVHMPMTGGLRVHRHPANRIALNQVCRSLSQLFISNPILQALPEP